MPYWVYDFNKQPIRSFNDKESAIAYAQERARLWREQGARDLEYTVFYGTQEVYSTRSRFKTLDEEKNPFVFVDYPKRHTKLFREAETGQFKRFPKRNPAKKYRIVEAQGRYARNRYLTIYRIVCDWDGRECPMSGEYRTRREACAAIAKLEAETGQFKRFPKRNPAKKRKEIPLYMLNVLNAYQKTGRAVSVFPFAGKMSLSGFPRVSYAEAYKIMKATLEKKNPNGSVMGVMRGQAGRRPIGKIWLKDVSDGSVTTLSTHFLDASEFETWVARKTKESAPYRVIIRKEFPIGTQVNPDLKKLLPFAGRVAFMAVPHMLKYGKRYLARRRRNPLPGSTRSARSPLREIYGRADMITATKGRNSMEPGQRRYHKFTTKPKVLGLPKGAVLYFPKQGRAFRMKSNHVLLAGRKDLWRNFKYRGNGI